MKIIVITAVYMGLVLSCADSFSQNTFPSSGNVGIGTTSPGAKLSFPNVDGASSTDGITWYNPDPLAYGIFRTSGSWTSPNFQQLKIAWFTGIVLDPGPGTYQKSYVDVMGGGLRISPGGASPINSTGLFQLNYSSNASYTGAIIKNSGTGSTSYAELSLYNNIDKLGQLFFTGSNYAGNPNLRPNTIGLYSDGSGGMAFVTADATAPITFGTGSTGSDVIILPNGRVGIGTATPDEMLTVNGKIHAKSVKIESTVPTPDYVFEDSYQLLSLDEVKEYVDQNKHLPEVPSAKEIEKNGIDVGEMNMLLLKKVEELTLYVIELKKRDQIQQEDLELLKKK